MWASPSEQRGTLGRAQAAAFACVGSVPVSVTCQTAMPSSLLTFVKYYVLDVAARSDAEFVQTALQSLLDGLTDCKLNSSLLQSQEDTAYQPLTLGSPLTHYHRKRVATYPSVTMTWDVVHASPRNQPQAVCFRALSCKGVEGLWLSYPACPQGDTCAALTGRHCCSEMSPFLDSVTVESSPFTAVGILLRHVRF